MAIITDEKLNLTDIWVNRVLALTRDAVYSEAFEATARHVRITCATSETSFLEGVNEETIKAAARRFFEAGDIPEVLHVTNVLSQTAAYVREYNL